MNYEEYRQYLARHSAASAMLPDAIRSILEYNPHNDLSDLLDGDPASPLHLLAPWDDWRGNYDLPDATRDLLREWYLRYLPQNVEYGDHDAAAILSDLTTYITALLDRHNSYHGQQLALPF